MPQTLLRRGCYSAAALSLIVAAACVDSPLTPTPTPNMTVLGAAAQATKPPLDNTLQGQAWVCKVGNGPTTDFTFAVSVDGGTAVTQTIANGDCALVHSVSTVGTNEASVSVTETSIPADWNLSSILIESNSSNTNHYLPVINSPNASARILNDVGVVFTFTNEFTPPQEETGGRMTGGGVQVFGGVKISRGFTIHCDLVLSNNVEVNWGKNKWHIDKPLTKATCIDDPAYNEKPPVAPFNTFIGEGIGRLNGVDGSKIMFTFIDAGEPGKNDKAAIKIIAPDGVTVVLDIPLSLLDNGNIQAHYDQPHGQHKP